VRAFFGAHRRTVEGADQLTTPYTKQHRKVRFDSKSYVRSGDGYVRITERIRLGNHLGVPNRQPKVSWLSSAARTHPEPNIIFFALAKVAIRLSPGSAVD